MKPIIDIVQVLINEDRMFNALVELPEKANFISAVTTLVTNSHFDDIRSKFCFFTKRFLFSPLNVSLIESSSNRKCGKSCSPGARSRESFKWQF